MKYQLLISDHNIKPHLDIENDIQKKKKGLFTFNLQVHQGNIENYAQFETVTAQDYEGYLWTGVKECGVTYDH